MRRIITSLIYGVLLLGISSPALAESNVTNGPVIPEPTGVVLFGVGMLLVGRALRRRAG